MTDSIQPNVAELEQETLMMVELTDGDLDAVNGGLNIDLSSIDSLTNSSSSDFFGRKLSFGQGTFAGPSGSGTLSMLNLEEVFSSAQQHLSIDGK